MGIESYAKEQLEAAKEVLKITEDLRATAQSNLDALLRIFSAPGREKTSAFINQLAEKMDAVINAEKRVQFAEALVAKREKDCNEVAR